MVSPTQTTDNRQTNLYNYTMYVQDQWNFTVHCGFQSWGYLSLSPQGSLGSGRQGGANTGWSLWGLIIGLFQLLMSLVAAVKRFCGCGDDSVDVDQTEERLAQSHHCQLLL